MNREVLRCSQGHDLRAVGEGISFCAHPDTGMVFVWEVVPEDTAYRLGLAGGFAQELFLRGYKANIFDLGFVRSDGNYEATAKDMAQAAIYEAIGVA